MQKLLILAQSEVTANVLRAWLESFGESVSRSDPAPAPMIVDPMSYDPSGGVETYHRLVSAIGTAAGLDEDLGHLGSIVVIVDSVRPAELSAITEGSTWEHLIAMLILTFPEIRWVFGWLAGEPATWSGGDDGGEQLRFPCEEHSLVSLLVRPPYDPLFDPTGLREWVKVITNETMTKLASDRGYQLPHRLSLAAIVDEEAEFARFHAYAAYRYGFRAEVITSWNLMRDRFGGGVNRDGSHHYSLLLEDMRLGFADKSAAIHLSRLTERARECPLLDNSRDRSRWRFLITTGQMGSDRELVRENTSYLEQKPVGRGGVLYKPVGGIADLWDRIGLYDDLSGSSRPGNAPRFVWPPTFDEEATYEGHGSPGKLTLIATTLLWRAHAIKKDTRSALGLIRGAVLASEAAELLGGRTPTLTFSAISLKHEFEVSAECEFMGATYHFNLNKRLKELDAEAASVARWYHEDIRRRSALEAKTKVINRLVIVFREAGRMEEELLCLVALRRLNRRLSAPSGFNPLSWLTYAVLSYGEWLLASFSRLIALILVWIVAFVIAAKLTGTMSLIETVTQTILWFGGEPFTKDGPVSMQVLSWIVVTTGIFHIGVLISYLYSLISRK